MSAPEPGAARQALHAVLADLGGDQLSAIEQAVAALVGGSPSGAASDLAAAEQELVDSGLSFLVQLLDPLQRCLRQVTGDADALESRAGQWRRIAVGLRAAVPEVDRLAAVAGAGWSGEAADRFAASMAEFADTVTAAAVACDDVMALLQTSGDLMSGARGLIADVIKQVIEYMIVAEASGAAAALLTAGGSEAAALAAILGRVGQAVETSIAIVDRVGELLVRIGAGLRDAHTAFARVAALLAELAAASSGRATA